MSADTPPLAKAADVPSRMAISFAQESGQSLWLWAVLAFLNLALQMVFRREMAPGEFGTINTVLGAVGLMIVPVAAMNQAFIWYLGQNHVSGQQERLDALRAAAPLITETWAWVWGGLSFLLLFPLLSLLALPRFSLDLFALLNVFIALAGVLGGVLCRHQGQLRFRATLLIVAAFVRLLTGAALTWYEPWAESGLTACVFAGFVILVPVFRQSMVETGIRFKALRTLLDRDFLFYLAATFSVFLAVFLFTSADRLVAQSWFGSPSKDNFGFVKDYVDWPVFDAYQTAGLIGRSLLWGTQPLLFILFARRSRLDRTTKNSFNWFWIYLGVLFVGVVALLLFSQPLSWIFCGDDFSLTAKLVPIFAMAMLPLGFLQGLGFFALASRRFHECFVLGGCGIGYALLLYLVGRQPQLMPAYMFGGGMVAVMIILFVGVVRWGRKQP